MKTGIVVRAKNRREPLARLLESVAQRLAASQAAMAIGRAHWAVMWREQKVVDL
jgi:hypothetical protein